MDAECKFSSQLTKRELQQERNYFQGRSLQEQNLAGESRYTFSLIRVALICSCGKL